MAEYVVALKRQAREQPEKDWQAVLSEIRGLVIKNAPGSRRLRVEATDEAIDEARARLSNTCHIEPLIPHRHV